MVGRIYFQQSTFTATSVGRSFTFSTLNFIPPSWMVVFPFSNLLSYRHFGRLLFYFLHSKFISPLWSVSFIFCNYFLYLPYSYTATVVGRIFFLSLLSVLIVFIIFSI